MSNPVRSKVFNTARAAYKALLRAQRMSFEGDVEMLREARKETRRVFLSHAGERDPTALQQRLAEAAEAEAFLRESVVQAALQPDTGRYTMNIRPEHTKKDGEK